VTTVLLVGCATKIFLEGRISLFVDRDWLYLWTAVSGMAADGTAGCPNLGNSTGSLRFNGIFKGTNWCVPCWRNAAGRFFGFGNIS